MQNPRNTFDPAQSPVLNGAPRPSDNPQPDVIQPAGPRPQPFAGTSDALAGPVSLPVNDNPNPPHMFPWPEGFENFTGIVYFVRGAKFGVAYSDEASTGDDSSNARPPQPQAAMGDSESTSNGDGPPLTDNNPNALARRSTRPVQPPHGDDIAPNSLTKSQLQALDPTNVSGRVSPRKEDGLFPCPLIGCTSLLKGRGILKNHLEKEDHRNKSYECTRCGNLFVRRDVLAVHVKGHCKKGKQAQEQIVQEQPELADENVNRKRDLSLDGEVEVEASPPKKKSKKFTKTTKGKKAR
ncbi:hypothetical protein BDN72DRAFT_960838 [Pluteus cervinus]|uniref:Uncharacterized protein n=1 Tax=Pluteus cervinus TaxID=181527 RepID=A0ACD3AQW6_9AGAR|nr:hypothetical protein BDN72DRAFT_960838 [Pluteus cervinus]